MNNLSATVKGLITGLAMIAVSMGIYFSRGNFDNNLQYIAYFMYIGGIIWTLVSYKKTSTEPKSFKNYFTQGFRFFIVVTLLMVLFTFIFLKMNPSFREEMAQNYRAELQKRGDQTPAEIDVLVAKAREYFITMFTSMAVFSYLVIGALVTLVTSAFLSQQKKYTNA